MGDALVLHRLQFAFTIIYHYLFPQLTMGLALLIVIMKARGLRPGGERWNDAARFWIRIFGINFAVGVVTGIPMEFQFGTNWAAFSRYAGSVIGQCVFGSFLFAISFVFGFGRASIFIAAVVTLLPLAFVIKGEAKRILSHDWAKARGNLEGSNLQKFTAFAYYASFLVFFIFFFDRAMIVSSEGIFTGGSNNLGDLPFHLGFIWPSAAQMA